MALSLVFLNRPWSADGLPLQTAFPPPPEALSEQTILDLALVRVLDGRYHIQFEDRGIRAGSRTHYRVQLEDKASGKRVFETELDAAFGNRQLSVPVTAYVITEHDHLIRLSVHRDGKSIAAPVRFVKEVHQVGQLAAAPYQNPENVRDFELRGRGESASLDFLDTAPQDGKVETRYEIRVRHRWLSFLWETTLAEASLNRKNLPVDSDGTVHIPVRSIPGLADGQLDQIFGQGKRLDIEVSVTRISPRLGSASPIHFSREAQVRAL